MESSKPESSRPTFNPRTGSPPAGVPAGTPVVLVQAPRRGFGRWFAWLGWLGLLMCVPVILGLVGSYDEYFDDSQGLSEKYHSLSRTAEDKVAVIRAVGVLAESDGFVKKQIERIRDDENVKAVVLRINSPGGTVTASDYLYHHLNELRDDRQLPIVVSMGGIAASGGYYIAMTVGDQQDSIFAEPTTTTGSIGVIVPHYDVSGLLAEYNVKNDSIVSHPRKQMLSMTRPVSEEDRKILQAYVNQSFERFKDVVRSGRPAFRNDAAALDRLATGEIFTAEQAQAAGLVDQIGFVEDAIERALELAELDQERARVITYRQPASLVEALGFATAKSQPGLVESLIDLSIPRAYYLFTTLPGMTSRRPAP